MAFVHQESCSSEGLSQPFKMQHGFNFRDSKCGLSQGVLEAIAAHILCTSGIWDPAALLVSSWARKSGVRGVQRRKRLPATCEHMAALKCSSSSAHCPHYSAVKGKASDLWCENYILTRCHMCLKSLFITILPHLLPKTQMHLISIL